MPSYKNPMIVEIKDVTMSEENYYSIQKCRKWCIYIGFSLTMAFDAKKCEYKNYVCSLLAGYVWSLAYVFFPSFMEKTFHIPSPQ